MIPTTPDGQPLNVVKYKNPESYPSLHLDTTELMKILGRDDVKSTPVVILSIAGSYRTGKSFMLNYIMRYLWALEMDQTDKWWGKPDDVLTGFHWKQGIERVTTGIVMWSKPFHIKSSDGKKVAVILMDTQGLFEDTLQSENAAAIFALSTMISSIQIYNILNNINEMHLKCLELFLETTQMVLEMAEDEHSEKPFQRLVYLVRDWTPTPMYHFGEDGGREYMKRYLETHGHLPDSNEKVRERIYKCFEEFDCFLMPHPGNQATETRENDDGDYEYREFEGELSMLSKNFVTGLKKLIPFLLGPDRLKAKKKGDVEMNGAEIANSITLYMSVFQSGKLPKAVATREALISEFNTLVTNQLMAYHATTLRKLYVCLRANEMLSKSPLLMQEIHKRNEKTKNILSRKLRGEASEKKFYISRMQECCDRWKNDIYILAVRERSQRNLVQQRICEDALEEWKRHYTYAMEEILLKNLNEEELNRTHSEQAGKVISGYKGITGGLDCVRQFTKELEEFITFQFETYAHRHRMRTLVMDVYQVLCDGAANEAIGEYRRRLELVSRQAEVSPPLQLSSRTVAEEIYKGLTEGMPEDITRGSWERLAERLDSFAILKVPLHKAKAVSSKSDGMLEEAMIKTDTCGNGGAQEKKESHFTTSLRKAEYEFHVQMRKIYSKGKPCRKRDEMNGDIKRCLELAEKVFKETTSIYPNCSDQLSQLREICMRSRHQYEAINQENEKTGKEDVRFFCLIAKYEARKEYDRLMLKKCGLGESYKTVSEMECFHNEAVELAKNNWKEQTAPYDTDGYLYLQDLENTLNDDFEHFIQQNELNNPEELPNPDIIIATIGKPDILMGPFCPMIESNLDRFWVDHLLKS